MGYTNIKGHRILININRPSKMTNENKQIIIRSLFNNHEQNGEHIYGIYLIVLYCMDIYGVLLYIWCFTLYMDLYGQ